MAEPKYSVRASPVGHWWKYWIGWRNPQSIRRTLTRRLVIALAVIGMLGAMAAALLGNRYANLAYDRALFDDVATLANQIEWRDGDLHVNLPDPARALLMANEGEQVRYRVIDLKRQRIVVGNGPMGDWDHQERTQGQPYFRDQQLAQTNFRIAYLYHVVDPTDWPVLVEVGESRGNRIRMAQQIVAATILLIALMIIAAVLLVHQGIRRSLLPMAKLEDEVALRSGNNLKLFDPLQVPEEVRRLVGSINQMMQRVSSTIEAQNRFIANAAHQLRTPMAGLRLQAQIALKAQTPQVLAASLREIEGSAGRAAHLIDQMLLLSRAEGSSSDLQTQPVNLVNVVQAVIGRHLQQSIRQQADLGYEGPMTPIMMIGNQVLLIELLSNLVDNALRYGRRKPSEGDVLESILTRVTVALDCKGAQISLSVRDQGPGFSASEKAKLFQRFYRPDSADAINDAGAGLGLAIVKEIAELHGASIRLDVMPSTAALPDDDVEVGQFCYITVCFTGCSKTEI